MPQGIPFVSSTSSASRPESPIFRRLKEYHLERNRFHINTFATNPTVGFDQSVWYRRNLHKLLKGNYYGVSAQDRAIGLYPYEIESIKRMIKRLGGIPYNLMGEAEHGGLDLSDRYISSILLDYKLHNKDVDVARKNSTTPGHYYPSFD